MNTIPTEICLLLKKQELQEKWTAGISESFCLALNFISKEFVVKKNPSQMGFMVFGRYFDLIFFSSKCVNVWEKVAALLC